MIAYHGNQTEKDAILAQLRAHRDADELIKGKYWQGGKGCAVGCTIHGSDHAEYERRFGIPVMLAKLEDRIFEGLPNGKAKEWPIRFMSSITPGADLSLVGWKFLHWLLTDETVNPGITHPLVRDSIIQCADVLLPLTRGELIDESARSAESAAARSARSAAARSAWSARSAAARSARSAESAESARSAESAESAAWSAAWSAESAARSAAAARSAESARSAWSAEEAAWSAEEAARSAESAAAAESAEEAARSAESAEEAAWSAEEAAWSAEEAARSAAAARSAWSAESAAAAEEAYGRMANKLVELLEAA